MPSYHLSVTLFLKGKGKLACPLATNTKTDLFFSLFSESITFKQTKRDQDK